MDVTDQGYLSIIFSDDVLRLDEFRKRLDGCDGATDVVTYIYLYEEIHHTVLSLCGQAKHNMQIIPVAKYIQDMKDLKPMVEKKAAELLPVYFEATEKRLMAEAFDWDLSTSQSKISELRELRTSSEYAYSRGFLKNERKDPTIPAIPSVDILQRAMLSIRDITDLLDD